MELEGAVAGLGVVEEDEDAEADAEPPDDADALKFTDVGMLTLLPPPPPHTYPTFVQCGVVPAGHVGGFTLVMGSVAAAPSVMW